MRHAMFRLFIFTLFAAWALSCSSGSGTTAPPADGDDDQVITDGDNIDPQLRLCLDFCERSYQCDQLGIFTGSELEACNTVCETLGTTCVTDSILECSELRRCDEFLTCVLDQESQTGCVFPVDGDVDGDSFAPHPTIDLPERIEFGAVVLGDRVERELEIGNSGDIILEVYSLLVTEDVAEFSVEGSDGVTRIRPDESASVVVSYLPIDGGRDEVELFVYSNDPNNRIGKVTLSSAYKGTANIGVNPTRLDFGIAQVEGDPIIKNITINNTPGNIDDNFLLTVHELTFANTSLGDFILSADTPETPFVIAPGDSKTVGIRFSPQTWGETSDMLEIHSDTHVEESRVVLVSLEGQGAARRLCINPNPIQYGTVVVGSDNPRQVAAESCGDSPVTMTSIKLGDDDGVPFTLRDLPEIPEGGLILAVGENVVFTVAYQPIAQLGVEATNLIVESNDRFEPIKEVGIRGQGAISNLSVNPTFLMFENVEVGTNQELNLRLKNTGSWNLEVQNVIFGLEDSPFSVVDADTIFPFTIQAGGAETAIGVRFEPVEVGLVIENMVIESTNTGGPITVGVSGTGTAPNVELSEEIEIDFGTVLVGRTEQRILTVRNSGGAPLIVSDFGITQGADVFTVSPLSLSDAIEHGESADLTITFDPDEVGVHEGLFYIDSEVSNPARQHIEVTLTGLAEDPAVAVEPAGELVFDRIVAGNRIGPLEVVITNNGVGTLIVESIEAAPGFEDVFAFDGPSDWEYPIALAPSDEGDDEIRLAVWFDPSRAGSFTRQIVISSNDQDAMQLSYNVSGEAFDCGGGTYNCDDEPRDCEYLCDGDPRSQELCNGEDDNCDCRIDEDFGLFVLNPSTGDAIPTPCDGKGACGAGVLQCDPNNPVRTICSTERGGADDESSTEICNGADDDCNGIIDDPFPVGDTCDGEGECGTGVYECKSPTQVRCSTDKGATADESEEESCDDRDNDCDGQTDERWPIGDSCNGTGLCEDGEWECNTAGDGVICNTLPGGSLYINEQEVCDSEDNDCDGLTDEDWDIGGFCDGVGDCGVGVWECAAGDERRCSTDRGGSEFSAPETEQFCDGHDDDCDGEVDDDFAIGEQCDGIGACGYGVYECLDLFSRRCSTDAGGSASQVQAEICDTLDNDCDGSTDENFNTNSPCNGVGACGVGVIECASTSTTRCSTDIGGTQYPGIPELCNYNVDDNCDGRTDEDFFTGTACPAVGVCPAGLLECSADETSAICSTRAGGSNDQSSPEVCDYEDNDCDGSEDEGFGVGTQCFGVNGICTGAEGRWNCDGSGGRICGADDLTDPIWFAGDPTETCGNSLDDNCDGQVDEGCR